MVPRTTVMVCEVGFRAGHLQVSNGSTTHIFEEFGCQEPAENLSAGPSDRLDNLTHAVLLRESGGCLWVAYHKLHRLAPVQRHWTASIRE